MNPEDPSYHRIIVNRQEQTLSRKVLGELRTLDAKTRATIVPPNLEYKGVEHTVDCQASRIWTTQKYTSFGDRKNMEPMITPALALAKAIDSDVQDPSNDKIRAWDEQRCCVCKP